MNTLNTFWRNLKLWIVDPYEMQKEIDRVQRANTKVESELYFLKAQQHRRKEDV